MRNHTQSVRNTRAQASFWRRAATQPAWSLTFMSDRPQRRFSCSPSAAAARGRAAACMLVGAACVLVGAAPAHAQDANPLDRIDGQSGGERTREVIQADPAPRAAPPAPRSSTPRSSIPHHHHHHDGYRDGYGPRATPGAAGPTPTGYDEVSEPRVGLIVGGSVLLGVAYGVPLSIVAAAEFPNETDWMAVPVVGNWITIARMRFGSCSNRRFVEEDCDDSAERAGDVLGAVALGFTGVMQAGGLAMIITGAAAQKTRLVPTFGVAPMPVRSGAGLMMSGSF